MIVPGVPSSPGTVFLAGEAGYPCFRIPSLVVSTHGTVVAFGEGRGLRTGSCGDHGDVMIVSKRSTTGGRTWGNLQVVRDEFAQGASSIGNPAPVSVVDAANSSKLLLLFNRDNVQTFSMVSINDGLSWSEPRDVTNSTCCGRPNVDFGGVGPPGGIQLASGRLVFGVYAQGSL